MWHGHSQYVSCFGCDCLSSLQELDFQFHSWNWLVCPVLHFLLSTLAKHGLRATRSCYPAPPVPAERPKHLILAPELVRHGVQVSSRYR